MRFVVERDFGRKFRTVSFRTDFPVCHYDAYSVIGMVN